MHKRVYISLFAVTLWGASAARADLTASSAASSPVSSNSPADVSPVGEQIAAVDAGPFGLLSIPSPLTDFAPPANPAATPVSEIRSIPAAPDSTVLCLWALGSIGAWQIARSSRKIHFSALPDWYHADAPDQIGHVSLFDLECRLMPAEVYVVISGELRCDLRRPDGDLRAIPSQEPLPRAVGPRAPPVIPRLT